MLHLKDLNENLTKPSQEHYTSGYTHVTIMLHRFINRQITVLPLKSRILSLGTQKFTPYSYYHSDSLNKINFNAFNQTTIRQYSSGHEEDETFEEFTTRFNKEFDEAYDLFEVQRVLNNCFSYDLVPAPSVIETALRATRRVNDVATAIRVFEALKYKVENEDQYKAYLDELKEVRMELGVPLKEELFNEK